MRIWIIEDQLSIRLGLHMLLELEGFQVHAFVRGEDAMRQLDEGAKIWPDVVLLDLYTDGMSPHDFQAELSRRSRDGRGYPVLGVISGSHEIAQISEQIGADFFLQKPFEVSEVMQRIKNLATVVRIAK